MDKDLMDLLHSLFLMAIGFLLASFGLGMTQIGSLEHILSGVIVAFAGLYLMIYPLWSMEDLE